MIKLAGNKFEIIQIAFQMTKIWSKQFWPNERPRFNLKSGWDQLHWILSLGLQLGSNSSRLLSAWLNSAWLTVDGMAGGPHCDDVSTDWSLAWLVGPTVMTCQLIGRWHGMPTVHADYTVMSC
jgi:hypothetical protein